jgi:hypothetical protein
VDFLWNWKELEVSLVNWVKNVEWMRSWNGIFNTGWMSDDD